MSIENNSGIDVFQTKSEFDRILSKIIANRKEVLHASFHPIEHDLLFMAIAWLYQKILIQELSIPGLERVVVVPRQQHRVMYDDVPDEREKFEKRCTRSGQIGYGKHKELG